MTLTVYIDTKYIANNVILSICCNKIFFIKLMKVRSLLVLIDIFEALISFDVELIKLL